jgi:predicted PurR-regulated permease PerM
MTLVGLLILGVDYPVVLALFAGLTEMIPIIGPFIGAIPAVIVGVSQAPVMGLWVALMYLIIQQLENHLIVPRVMSKASGLNPVIVIIAILVGGKLFSITGVILAVPTMIIITTFLEDFLEEKKASDLKLETSDQP